MKKLKLALVAIAIAAGVGGAFGTKPAAAPCENALQYYYDGSYHDAGEYGVDYACWNMPGTCTYYKPDPIGQPNTYAPCKSGIIQLFH